MVRVDSMARLDPSVRFFGSGNQLVGIVAQRSRRTIQSQSSLCLALDAEDYAFRAGAGSLVGGRLAQFEAPQQA